ncbi:hypothetical protein LINGRAHAP2_LOCUS11747, partial [Linum grandiflorum]
ASLIGRELCYSRRKWEGKSDRVGQQSDLYCFSGSFPKCRPEIFKSTTLEDTNRSSLPKAVSQEADEHNSSEDEYDDLPPLVANKNRIQPPSSEVDSESDTGSDSDS